MNWTTDQLFDMAFVPDVARARRSTIRAFARFCVWGKHKFFPTSEKTLLAYATFLMNNKLKASTIAKYIGTICSYNRMYGHSISSTSYRIHLLLRGIKRAQKFQPSSKAPFTPVELLKIRATLDWKKSLHRSFWACLVIGFWSFLRGGNLLPKSKGDFSPDCHLSSLNMSVDAENKIILFSLKRTKTIQFNERSLVIPLVAINDADMCPITALRTMWELCPLQKLGSIFTYVDGGVVKSLLHSKFNELIKSSCKLAGLDESIYSAHSLRKGGTTVALMAGVDEILVKAQGDWISNAYRRYITFSLDQKLSVPKRIAEAMQSPAFGARCKTLALPLAASLYDLGA